MNQGQDQGVNFEERLLAELRAVVEERAAHAGAGAGVERNRRYATVSLHSRLAAGGGRRLAPRLVFGGAAVAAVAAAVLAVSSGTDDTSSAFAVEPQGDGEVRVEISSLSDAEGLEKALGEAGIKADVNYLAAGMACREPRFTPNSGGGGPERSKSSSSVRQTDSGVVFTITRSGIDPGDTLLVTASPGPEGIGDMLSVQIAEGAVSACVPVAAPELPPGAVTQSSGPQNGGPQKGLSQSGG